MRNFRQCVVIVLMVAGSGIGQADAQECGDANASGDVTVADGVLALRRAALLRNRCLLCDMDANSSLTIVDGVLVLRKAASLPEDESLCKAQKAFGVLGKSGSAFGDLTKSGLAKAAGSDGSPCDNPEGRVELSESGITFIDCLLGPDLINGSIDYSKNGVSYRELTITDVQTDEFVRFNSSDGPISTRVEGDDVIITGRVDVATSEAGSGVLSFEEVRYRFDSAIAGVLAAEVTTAGGIVRGEIAFAETPELPAKLIFEDQTEKVFLFNQGTGAFVPVA